MAKIVYKQCQLSSANSSCFRRLSADDTEKKNSPESRMGVITTRHDKKKIIFRHATQISASSRATPLAKSNTYFDFESGGA